MSDLSRSKKKLKTKEPGYRNWHAMKDRCLNPKHASYKKYGAKGIKIYPAWIKDFWLFIEHIGKKPTNKHQIDRIDSSRDYEPGNVRWATSTENVLNSSIIKWFEIGGEMKYQRQIEREYKIGRGVLHSRLKKGMTIEQAIDFKKKKNGLG